ncbi:MAG TPA: metallopeptidase TldD-related protein [Jatrophihabitans sp.]|jgi:predicted Zn-dependent protease|uniref:metallopeptidase TldD-related protein n=1 Tax=Jatrophihabitans sp. TaxID=1932789 RepID=UPI002E07849A|nr:metallopeptidase TldD-related protein [Jatrophihabitans sp.]
MSDPRELVEAALAASSADGCIVIAAEHSETNLRFAANSLTTNGQMRSRSVTVISTFTRPGGTSAGVVTRSVVSLEEVDDLVRASEDAGRDADPADDAAPLVEPYPNDDDWDADPAATSVAVFERFAPELGAAFARWSSSDRLLYGFAEHSMTSYFLGTSTGLRRRFDQPDGRLELNGKSADLARSAWSGLHTRDFTDVDVAALTASLEQRLEWARKRIDLPAGRYETILPPTAVADLMIYAYWTASARDAEEGRNVYAGAEGSTRIGERLSALPFRLHSDPSAAGLQCAPFEIASASSAGLQSVFDNGQPAAAATWIGDGTITDLVRTRSWAERTGRPARPLIDNLILDSGTDAGPTLEEMIARTERGLLLTCLWYIREVDPQTLLLTGLTRDGVYLVENGEVQGAVNNFRFNESPIDLLTRATEIGRSGPTMSREWSDYFRRTAMPALRIPDFNMSTVSEAS